MAAAAFEPAGFLAPRIFGLPVNRDILFANHNDIYKKRIEKRQRKLIVKVSFLKDFFKKGEQILLITTGYSPLNSAAQYLVCLSKAIPNCFHKLSDSAYSDYLRIQLQKFNSPSGLLGLPIH